MLSFFSIKVINIFCFNNLQNNRKRKQHSSSGAANSTGTGNTVGPSPSSPASTHTPGDGITTASSMQHVNSVPKSLMLYGPEDLRGWEALHHLLICWYVNSQESIVNTESYDHSHWEHKKRMAAAALDFVLSS